MLEAIIAAGIIVTAVSSSLTLVSASIGAEKESEGRIVAGGLAREGIEVVRSIRDSNWLSDQTWDTGLEGASNDYSGVPAFDASTNTWSILFTPSAITDPTAVVYRFVNGTSAQTTTGLYVQAGSQPSNTTQSLYRRILFLYPLCDNDVNTPVTTGPCTTPAKKVGMQVISQVQWRTGGQLRSVQMEERMFNWR